MSLRGGVWECSVHRGMHDTCYRPLRVELRLPMNDRKEISAEKQPSKKDEFEFNHFDKQA